MPISLKQQQIAIEQQFLLLRSQSGLYDEHHPKYSLSGTVLSFITELLSQWFGVVVTSLVRSTKLLYARPD